MQKKLLTMAVAGALAAPVAAFADVTVYGTIDTGVRSVSKLHTPAGPSEDDSRLEISEGTRTTNRWGLRGSEDLGGGLMANFTLEGQYASDTGAGPGSGRTTFDEDGGDSVSINNNQGLFQRKAIVGLSKGGMSVDLGRDYTVNFKSQGIYDPMSYTYTGITPSAGVNVAGTRSSNMITAGFRFGNGGVRVDYALGETLDNAPTKTQDNDRIGVMGDFAFGPVTVTAAYSTIETNVSSIKGIDLEDVGDSVGIAIGASVPADVDTMNFGAAYTMGAFTFRGGWSNTEYDPGAAGAGVKVEEPLLMAGVQYAFSPTLNGRIGYYDEKLEVTVPGLGSAEAKRKTFVVSLDYYLSKRTTLYAVVDRKTLDDNAQALAQEFGAAGERLDGSTGLGVGIAHAF